MNIGVFPRPQCTNPSLLVNRNAVNLLLNGGELRKYWNLSYRDDSYDACTLTFNEKHEFDYKQYCRIGYSYVTHKKVNGTMVTLFDDDTFKRLALWVVVLGNQFEFFYQVVACGHCDICVEKKLNDFSNRCQWESQTSETRPLFVTLTYDNKNIPRWVDDNGRVRQRGIPCDVDYEVWFRREGHKLPYDVRVQHPVYREMMAQRGLCHNSDDDIKKFLKRLRIRWSRCKDVDYNQDRKLRYVRTSEYGSNSQHPHTHLLLWNVPLDVSDTDAIGIANTQRILHDIECAWNMGRVDCQVARDAARYVSKYVSKQDENGNKSKRAMSNRGGGIGAPYLKQMQQYYLDHPTMQVVIGRDKWSGNMFEHTMGAFATNKLFPPMREYVDKNDFRSLYEVLINRCTSYLRDMLPYVSRETFNDIATNLYTDLKALKPCNDYHFIDLPKWEYVDMTDKFSVYHQPVTLDDKMLTLVNGKQKYVMLSANEIYSILLDCDIRQDIDKMLALRVQHQQFIPVQPLSDDFVYMKQLQVHAKQVSRREREKF